MDVCQSGACKDCPRMKTILNKAHKEICELKQQLKRAQKPCDKRHCGTTCQKPCYKRHCDTSRCQETINGLRQQLQSCQMCNGTGNVPSYYGWNSSPCQACNGKGTVPKTCKKTHCDENCKNLSTINKLKHTNRKLEQQLEAAEEWKRNHKCSTCNNCPDLQTKLDAAEAQISQMREHKCPTCTDCPDLRSKLDTAEAQISQMREHKCPTCSDCPDLRNDILALKLEIVALKEKIEQHEKEKHRLQVWEETLQDKEEELTKRERALKQMKKEIDELKALLEKAVAAGQGGHTVLEVVELYTQMKRDYDAKETQFDVDRNRFENERSNLKAWFRRHKWTLNTGSGRRNSITLTHKLETTGKITKFEDLSKEYAILEELVRCFRSEEANMDQLKDLERRIREHAQTKIDLKKERGKLNSVLQRIKRREAELAKMDVNQVRGEHTAKRRRETRKNKQELKKLEKIFAKEKMDIARLRGLLEAGERDIDRMREKYITLMKNLGVEVKESDLPSPSARINLEGYNHKLEPQSQHRENPRINRRRLQVLDRLLRSVRNPLARTA